MKLKSVQHRDCDICSPKIVKVSLHGPFEHADNTITVCVIIEAGGYNFLRTSGNELDKTHTICVCHCNGYVSDISLRDMLLLDGTVYKLEKLAEHDSSSVELEMIAIS